jgi:type IV secretory pathway VirJ component
MARAADDFDYIRYRMEQLRSERTQMICGQSDKDTDIPSDQRSGRRPGTRETIHIGARWAVSLSRRS